MYIYDLIQKKRDKESPFTTEELEFLVKGYTEGDIPDYQMSALLMAIFLNGLNDHETADLTASMTNSGEILKLSDVPGPVIDKHSSGGVGDKTTFVTAPIAASCGVTVAKMSGRGLGHTGGTIDKLESIPGFDTAITIDRFQELLKQNRFALMGQTLNLAPADKKIYALRDVTATVESIPLIASSIMSKKLAAGADGIVLDVKCGSGAFMKTFDDAKSLADTMIAIGRHHGRKMTAIISDMDQPLGYAVGNALEVQEAIDTLKGNGPADFTELCLVLSAHMILLGNQASTYEEAYDKATVSLQSGAALKKFYDFVMAQGGTDLSDVKQTLTIAPVIEQVAAEEDGYITSLLADPVGECETILGGGRMTLDDQIDHSVGIVLHKKRGDFVKQGDILADLHANDPIKAKEAKSRLSQAYTIGTEAPQKHPLILSVIS